MHKTSCFLLLLALLGCVNKNVLEVTVTNPSALERSNEIIEMPLTLVILKMQNKDFIVTDANNKQIPYQKTFDNKLIFPVSLPANGRATYTIKEGTPEIYTSMVYGQHFPERLDDIAWENDRIAFRAYGPALQATGEKAYGFDIWVKRVPEPVVKERYRKELEEGISYHTDHGDGLDYYKVGPTLGAGTPALLVNDTIAYPYGYATYNIVDNGPLRFTVKLTYHPQNIHNAQVVEHRTVSLDAGSQLNKITVFYKGLTETLPVVAGIVLHDSDNTVEVSREEGYIAYADPADPENGQTYIGAVFTGLLNEAKAVFFSDEEKAKRGANGHVLGIATYRPGTEFVYYAGAGWSKWGFETPADWFEYVKTYSALLKEPLEVIYE